MKNFIELTKKEGFDFIVDKQNDCFQIVSDGYCWGVFESQNIDNLIKELKENIIDCDLFENYSIIVVYQTLIKLAIKAKQMEA